MIRIRPAAERGHLDHGWLNAKHSFSFGNYRDPEHMGFSVLRVINEDRIAPATGFGTHPHEDMEILTWVLEGGIHHRDSMGEDGVIRPGEMQRMSAGTGVTHSEENDSPDQETHLLQIWLLPERRGIEPGYEQKAFPEAERTGRLQLLASRDGREGSLTIHQDAAVYNGVLREGHAAEVPLAAGRQAWVQVARGSVELNGRALGQGDGAAVTDEALLSLAGTPEGGEVLVFDLP